ncbi:MAG: non-homologous end-joining DNA ligase, partial [Actinobacteria bacterium]|nr:non-homologous end-joining DNA ligase [Actinomycetota bacterium]
YTFEVKWDGVRVLTYIDDGTLRMESRNLNDITPRYPEMHGLLDVLGGRQVLLDGEVVAFDDDGNPSFGVLQSRMHVGNPIEVRRLMETTPVVYMLFDVLWLDGTSTMSMPLRERRVLLEGLGLAGPGWQTPTSHVGDGAALQEASKARGLEGIVAKKLDSIYEPGKRTRQWIKIKNQRNQELVIGGWMEGEGNREGRIGALLVGYYDDDDELRFAGKVGTGFTDATLRDLATRFAPLARDTNPFDDHIPYRKAHFLEPELVGQVEFLEWTHNHTLRAPSYKGLRDDKAAKDVRREP